MSYIKSILTRTPDFARTLEFVADNKEVDMEELRVFLFPPPETDLFNDYWSEIEGTYMNTKNAMHELTAQGMAVYTDKNKSKIIATERGIRFNKTLKDAELIFKS